MNSKTLTEKKRSHAFWRKETAKLLRTMGITIILMGLIFMFAINKSEWIEVGVGLVILGISYIVRGMVK